MSKKARKNIELQKTFYEEAIVKKLADLKDTGLESARILKDNRLRHLKGRLRQANRRLHAISENERQIGAMAIRRAERLERKQKEVKPAKKSLNKPVSEKKKEKKNRELRPEESQ